MDKGIKRLWMITGIFALGVALGALYSARSNPEVLYEYFKGLSGGEISIKTGTQVITSVAVWAMLFFSAFFKFGVQLSALIVGMRGFLDGFSVCSILRILGIRGIGLCFFDIFTAPLIILMSLFSAGYLKSDRKNTGEFILKSILALILIVLFSWLSAVISGAVTPDAVEGIIT